MGPTLKQVFLKVWSCGMDEAAVKIILHEYFGLFFIDDDEVTSCIFFLVNLYGKVLKCALHIIEFPCCCSLLDQILYTQKYEFLS